MNIIQLRTITNVTLPNNSGWIIYRNLKVSSSVGELIGKEER